MIPTHTCIHSQTHNINFLHGIFNSVPDPNVTIISNKSNPIRPVGSAVKLTCTVELSQAVDVPVTLNTVWTGPDGFMATNRSLLTIETRDAYTTVVTIASVGRSQSGDYYCSVSIGSASSNMITHSSTTTAFTKVTVGENVSPNTVYELIVNQNYTTALPILRCLSVDGW